MQAHTSRQPRRSSLLRPIVAALTAAFVTGAWADEPSPYYIGADLALKHDSNVYRVSDDFFDANLAPLGRRKDDNYSSTGLLGGFDQAIGRQRLHAAANVRYNKYQDNSTLDNTSYAVNAGWDWATIEQLSGTIGVSANQALSSFDSNASKPTTSRNLLKTDQVSTSVRWGGAGALSLQGDYAHSRVRYTAPEYVNSDSSADSGSIGAFYKVSPDIKLGGSVRLTRSVAPNGVQTGPTTFDSNTSNGRNLDLSVDWRYTVQTGVVARLSWTRQTNSATSGQDFSGATGAIAATYAPTGKLSFNLGYSREAGTNGSFFNVAGTSSTAPTVGLYENSQVSDAVSLGATYAATAKINATAGYQYRRAKIVGSVAGGSSSVAGTDYTDNLRSASLGLTYAIARSWQVSCNLSHETRSVSTTPPNDYSATVAGCAAQFTIR